MPPFPSYSTSSEIYEIVDAKSAQSVDLDGDIVEDMVIHPTNVVPNGEAETPGQEDEPWSVMNVADASSNKRKKYTIYIRTPTQHLTLIRGAQEISDVHTKLRSNHPKLALPPLPGFSTTVSDADGPKRRNSFFDALSSLSNPNPKAALRLSQPFGIPRNVKDTSDTERMLPMLVAYLTLVGNHPIFRRSRTWRKFVRVRTDDLQSVHAERVVGGAQSKSTYIQPNNTANSNIPHRGVHFSPQAERVGFRKKLHSILKFNSGRSTHA
ncbi:unnamed protein product [Rhizoctonia solani]|uniref:PX domain-containing protein n=1 Tax=Rhizoctonia solani TaxID=456999 RepID=A0A8H3CZ90_9AGAM|nr:unnamed protein product [Rhizoctonia solani]